jgi:hypothetical protein
MAIAVIRFRHLNPEDCSFCIYRNFQVPADCDPLIERHCIDVSYTYAWMYRSLTGLGIRRRFKMAYVDRFLNKATCCKKFEAYLTPLNALSNLIVSHPNCVHYHFIEEGYSGHFNPFDTDDPVFSQWSRYFEKLNHRRFRTIHRCLWDCSDEKFGTVFVSLEECLPREKNAVVVPGVFQKDVPPSFESPDAFLVIDMVAQYGEDNPLLPSYIKTLDELISEHFIPKGYRRVLYKSRQFEENEKLAGGLRFLEQKYADVLILESLPQDCFFENTIYSCDAPVYFVQSSVGFYANAFHKETYTIINICNSFDPEWTYEFYLSGRNRMARETGVAELPCDTPFADRLSVVKSAVLDVKTLLQTVK